MSPFDSLPPHLTEFVRRQLADGRFRSEDDVIQTALTLLEGQVHSHDDTVAWLKHEIEKGISSRPAAPVTPAFWDDLRRRVDAADPDRAG